MKADYALGYVSTQIWYFSDISQFPKILSLKSFGNLFGNSYIKFAILDIKVPFTCGESDLYWNIVKFQNFLTRIVVYKETIKDQQVSYRLLLTYIKDLWTINEISILKQSRQQFIAISKRFEWVTQIIFIIQTGPWILRKIGFNGITL